MTFKSDTLTVAAQIFDGECHYIAYALPHPWTDEQLPAALRKNGTGWAITDSPGMLLFPKEARSGTFRSREGHEVRLLPGNSCPKQQPHRLLRINR